MRVLTVLDRLNPGGIEVQLLQAVPWLQRQGVTVDFCCAVPPGTLDARFEALGCRIHRVPKTPNCYSTARHLQRLLEREPYDVVHSHLGHSSGGFALGAHGAGVPAAVSFHSAMPLSLYRWRTRPVLRQLRSTWLKWHGSLIRRYARMLVGHSRVNLERFAPDWRQHPNRCRVIMNGVDFPSNHRPKNEARRRLGLAAGATVLLHVGSLKPEKNHAGLLAIFQRVLKRQPQAQLVLVGDGRLRPAIERHAKSLGVLEGIHFAGLQNNVWPYYAAADVFVFPSESEGFGNAVVESQAAGVPVVASDIAAHHESLAPQQHRFLFPLPDYDRAAELVLEQIELASAGSNPWVGQSAEFVKDRFSIQRFALDLVTLYQDLSGDRSIEPGAIAPRPGQLIERERNAA
jgi:glycosyltransferase EpsF